MIGGSLTKEIAASPDTVWETVTDAKNATKILRNVIEQEVVKQQTVAVGTVVREVRIFKGKRRESFRTITAVSTDPHNSISTNVYLTKRHALSGSRDAARTGSWTIVEGNDANSSVFVWTYSAIPEGWCESIATLCCGACMLATLKKHFEQDLADYATEAERRQRLKDRNNDSLVFSSIRSHRGRL